MSDTTKVICIYGNKSKPEPAEHIIKFPGGSIALCRTSDNEYWAHIEVNRGHVNEDMHREAKAGEIVDTRLDYEFPHSEIKEVENSEHLQHLAIRIKTN